MIAWHLEFTLADAPSKRDAEIVALRICASQRGVRLVRVQSAADRQEEIAERESRRRISDDDEC